MLDMDPDGKCYADRIPKRCLDEIENPTKTILEPRQKWSGFVSLVTGGCHQF